MCVFSKWFAHCVCAMLQSSLGVWRNMGNFSLSVVYTGFVSCGKGGKLKMM